jgi:hypothetical protein
MKSMDVRQVLFYHYLKQLHFHHPELAKPHDKMISSEMMMVPLTHDHTVWVGEHTLIVWDLMVS